jgi:hypothetical protein
MWLKILKMIKIIKIVKMDKLKYLKDLELHWMGKKLKYLMKINRIKQ